MVDFGVLYIVSPHHDLERLLKQSIASLPAVVPHMVRRYEDIVAVRRNRTQQVTHQPFHRTLYLDTDTRYVGPPDGLDCLKTCAIPTGVMLSSWRPIRHSWMQPDVWVRLLGEERLQTCPASTYWPNTGAVLMERGPLAEKVCQDWLSRWEQLSVTHDMEPALADLAIERGAPCWDELPPSFHIPTNCQLHYCRLRSDKFRIVHAAGVSTEEKLDVLERAARAINDRS